jgi:hypothetical protein
MGDNVRPMGLLLRGRGNQPEIHSLPVSAIQDANASATRGSMGLRLHSNESLCSATSSCFWEMLVDRWMRGSRGLRASDVVAESALTATIGRDSPARDHDEIHWRRTSNDDHPSDFSDFSKLRQHLLLDSGRFSPEITHQCR